MPPSAGAIAGARNSFRSHQRLRVIIRRPGSGLDPGLHSLRARKAVPLPLWKVEVLGELVREVAILAHSADELEKVRVEARQ